MSVALLRAGTIFQLGYVTNDVEAAAADCRSKLGIEQFLTFEVGAAAGRPVPYGARIALAWSGATMLEFIQPVGQPAPVYVDDLGPPGPLTVAFNHIGLIVADDGRWTEMLETAAQHHLDVAWHGSDPSRLDVAYFDTRGSLGHYLEFIKMNDVMADLMERVPES